MQSNIKVQHFFHTDSSTLTYVVFDKTTHDAVVIDPVWDYDPLSSCLSAQSAIEVIGFIKSQQLKLHYILETHAHADHVSGAQLIKNVFPSAQIAIGHNIIIVQQTFKNLFNIADNFHSDGSQFDKLLNHNETIKAGSLSFKTMFTPGHTPACVSYLFFNLLFTGDCLFMPDYGCGRCDFPNGSAEDLYTSVTVYLYQLPDETIVFVGHDYQPNGRPLMFQTTIAEQKNHNIHIPSSISKIDFVALRIARDQTLKPPRLLYPSIQVNINAGKLYLKDQSDRYYLKIPLYIK